MTPANPQKPIRLLIADVDGTLVTQEKILTPRAIQSVMALRAAGIRVADSPAALGEEMLKAMKG